MNLNDFFVQLGAVQFGFPCHHWLFCNSSDAAVLSPEGFPPGGRGRIGEALDGILYNII